MSTSEVPPPMIDATPPRGTAAPRKTSPLAKAVVALALIGLAVPVGAKIRTALAKQKALEADRKETAASAAAKNSAPVAVKITHAKSTTWTPSVPFDGTLQPIQEASLAFKATGPLAQLKVKTGDYVKKGDLLGALDATEAYAQSKVASAQIAAAKAQLALAKDNAATTNAMVKSGAAPGVQGTQANGQVDLVTAQLAGAEAQLQLSNAFIANHRLVAPFDGWVTAAPTAMGGLVTAGAPVFQVKDTSKLRLVGTISELDISLVKLGAEVTITIPVQNKTVKAKVSSVLPSVDPATRRIPVEASFDNDAKEPILAGTFVRAQVAGGSALEVLQLPGGALKPGSQDEILIVEGKKLKTSKIVFTRSNDGSLLVRSGVTADDAVLANPSPESKDGDTVTVEKSE
jgi:RND family efflux transporter MFP subunit